MDLRGDREKEVVLDSFAVIMIGVSMLWFSFGLTLVKVDLNYTILCILGLLVLLSGLSMGSIIHGYSLSYGMDVQGILTGLIGLIFVSLAQLPALLLGLSIYGLSAVSSSVLFLVSQAVAEEVFFANFLYYYVREMSFSRIHAMVSTAAIFTAFHWAVYSQNSIVLFVVFLSRLSLNYIFEQGGLTASVTTHTIVNFLSGVMR